MRSADSADLRGRASGMPTASFVSSAQRRSNAARISASLAPPLKAARRSALSSSSARESVLPGSPLGSSTRAVSVRPSVRLDRHLADPARRVGGVDFGVELHLAPCRGRRRRAVVAIVRLELGQAGAAGTARSGPAPCPSRTCAWCTVCGSTTGPSTSIAPWCTCVVTRAMCSARRSCSRITCSSASAAGCVWRHEAWNLNEVSASAQRCAEAVGQARRIGIARHAGRHALRAFEDALARR